MADKILKKSDLTEFVKSLTGDYEVLAPVQDGPNVKFAPVADGGFLLEYQNTTMSPKDLFFPQSEKLLVFSLNKEDQDAFIMKEPEGKPGKRVVFGMRPCDAKAFFVLDKIFKNDQFTDPYWQEKRDATVIIGLGCNTPCPTCFCGSVNCGPFHEEGLDALAFDLGEEYLIKPLTEKGQKILDQAKGLGEPRGQVDERACAIKSAAQAALTSQVDTANIFKRTVLELFNAGHWAKVHESCLNCGTCTYFCPTCHCFDIQDEVHQDQGDRVRNWDTCMSWLFTIHGTGHNPRPGKMERVRQRFMHKFKYIPMKRGGEIGCVGCGRCIVQCPVNIDVRDVVRDMNA
ncbi:MAG: 4Fe-4S dicluster domain-containing protein [Pseudomonadota bacterium]